MHDELVLDGKFRVLASLGERAGEQVFAGLHLSTGREVELHLLPAGLSARSPEGERLLRAARASGRAPHSNVLNVVDSGTDAEGRLYVVYERFACITLSELIERQGPLALGAACEVMLQVLAGLGALHGRGVMHRYLRPENILIEATAERPRVKLAHLGFALITANARATGLPREEPELPRGYSRFLAPEVRRGEVTASAASDVYAAGVLLRWLSTGESEPNPTLPRELAGPVARATNEDPDERFASAAHFAAVLSLLVSEGERPCAATVHDALLSDLQYMLQRRDSSCERPARGGGRLELYPVLLMIEALYARLGAGGWQGLVRDVPEAADLLPAAGKGAMWLEQGVPMQIVVRMLAAADSECGRGDLSMLLDIGAALSKRGVSRFCREYTTLQRVEGLVDCAPLIWSSLSRHGAIRVLERKAQGARFELYGQVEPSLELMAVFGALLRAEACALAPQSELHLSACHAVGDASDIFVLSFG